MRRWQLQDAEHRINELTECALREGPQLITKQGRDALVVLAVSEYRRLTDQDGLVSLLLQAPRGKLLEHGHPPKPIRALTLE